MISVSGRLDLVSKEIKSITCPSLLIAGELDFHTLNINRYILKYLKGQKQLAIIPGASHLFEEIGKQEKVAMIISSWLKKYIPVKQEKLTV